MLYYTYEVINGQANQTVYGRGLTSTEAERKRIRRVYVIPNARAGNDIQLWIEKEKIADVKDSFFPLATEPFRKALEVDVELEVGKSLVPAIKCGGTATNITVIYEYEVPGT